MKKIYLFLLMFCSLVAVATDLPQSTATTISIGVIRSTTSGLLVTSCIPANITANISKNGVKSTITLTASGGNNDLTADGDGFYNLELTASNTDTLGRLEVHLTKADYAIDGRIFNIVEQTYWNTRASTAARIASVSDYVDTEITSITGYVDDVESTQATAQADAAARIASATADIANASSTLQGLIELNATSIAGVAADVLDVSAMVRAGSALLPFTGGLIGRPVPEKVGNSGTWVLSVPVLSRSAADPGLKITVVESDAGHSLYATQADFTRVAWSASTGIGSVTPVMHDYQMDISGAPFQHFVLEAHILNDGDNIAAIAGSFINSSTFVFQDSAENIATMAYLKSTMRDLASGIPAEVTRYQAVGDIARGTPVVSTEINRYIPSGKPAVTITTYTDSDDIQWNVFGYYDYSESNDTLRRKWYSTTYSTLADLVAAWGIDSASMATW